MVQGGFCEPRKMSPGAIGVVVLLHGAAIAALVMAKENVFRHIKEPPIVVKLVKDKTDPPPVPPQPKPQPIDVLTTVRTPVPPPIPVFPIRPPDTPTIPIVTTVAGTTTIPTIDVTPPLPPAPLPPVTKLEPARARANLASYLSDADYPSDAIRREEQGATRFKLAVGADGRVSGCTVTASSGSAALDLATCRLMKSRARFAPARDTSGSPTTDVVSSTIVWRLPAG